MQFASKSHTATIETETASPAFSPSETAAQPRQLHPEVLAAFPGAPRQTLNENQFASLDYRLRVDSALVDRLTEGIVQYRKQSACLGYGKLVLGMSGGLDSVVCAALCRRSCQSSDEILAVTVRMEGMPEVGKESRFAALARALDVTPVAVDGRTVQAAFRSAWPEQGAWSAINIETRTVQSLIFQVADSVHGAVVATTDRSEALMGRHTEGFFGQIAPLQGLFKSEARELADLLGVRTSILDVRPGCEAHWYDDEILGVGYEVLDPLLYLLADRQLDAGSICGRFGIEDLPWIQALAARIETHPLRTATRELSRETLQCR